MKKLMKLILMLVVFMNISLKSNGQNKISRIFFEYIESGIAVKPKYSKIRITIEKIHSEITMDVSWESIGVKKSAEIGAYNIILSAAKTKQDSTRIIRNKPLENKGERAYKLSLEQFEKITQSIDNIEVTEITKSFNKVKRDGYTCSIKFGSYGDYIKYQIHSPGYNGKKEGNPNFSEACKLILKTAEIKPREIL